MQGTYDSPLTDLGRRQAAWQREILRRAGAEALKVYCSPLGRAIETAAIACPGSRPRLDARLAEVGMGSWQGLTMAEIDASLGVGRMQADPVLWKFRAPGGESLAAMTARIRGFLHELPAPAVVVTHGVASQLIRGELLGLDAVAWTRLEDRQGVVYRVADRHQEILALGED